MRWHLISLTADRRQLTVPLCKPEDVSAYARAVAKYGTHVIMQGEYGGKIRMMYQVDRATIMIGHHGFL